MAKYPPVKKLERGKRDLTSGSIIRNIWYLALPMMIGYVLQDAFNIVDMIFVGRLGPAAIAAVSMSGIFLGVIFTGIIGISIGTVAMVARFFGSRQFEQADKVATQSFFLAIFGSIPLTILGYLFAEPLLKFLGAEKEVVFLGTSYLRITFLGSVTMFLYFVLSQALRGAGDPVTPMKILALSTALNIALDPLLIFGLWIFPRWGVAGSALATVIARTVGMLILLYVFFRGRSLLHIDLKGAKLNFNLIWRIIRIGIFGSLQMIMWNISDLIVMRIVAIYGTFALAACGIGMRVSFVIQMPGFALAQAAATLVGQNLGARKPERAERSAWISTGFYEIIMIAAAAIFIIRAEEIVKIFNTHPEVVRMGASYLRFIGSTFFFIALSTVLGRAMGGAGDTLSPMVITSISLFAFRIPLVLFLAQVQNLATTGLWAGIAISNVVSGLSMAFWFSRGRWKHKAI